LETNKKKRMQTHWTFVHILHLYGINYLN